jgi:hypothetical protein
MHAYRVGVSVCALVLLVASADAKMNVVVVHQGSHATELGFKLRAIAAPAPDDAAAKAKISIIEGARDQNGGELSTLQDGKVPTGADEPADNFFFAAGSPGGRLLIDLGTPIAIDQVNNYSWHRNTRGPQVYKLYGSDGMDSQFNREPSGDADPEQTRWKLLAEVDTRPSGNGAVGGQYGASIFDSEGSVGPFRYLLFDISRTENHDPFGNTFYSEIDVIAGESATGSETPAPKPYVIAMETDEGTFEASIDTSRAPDLTRWANEELAPVVKEWYPKIVKMLPSDGFEAPRRFSIRFSPNYRGVAATDGTRIVCSPAWFRRELDREAKGAVVHELVHVVQQYGRARHRNPDARRPPGWLVEGIADYIRWFLYEPQSRGAEITERNFERARFNGSYRISANFLNWVTNRYDTELVPKLNAAIRDGRYNEDLWADYAERTLAELDGEWRSSLARALNIEPQDKPAEAAATDASSAASQTSSSPSPDAAALNTLSDAEKAAGWKLLFDGETLKGWHTFRMDGVRPGWQVKDGVITCADPQNAGDLCTNDEYDWFELRLDYNISEGGNSGIMYHVTDEGRTAWATGPEVQLQDNEKGRDPMKSGWLYALYEPPTDTNTGKPLDATKPAGEWNQITLLIAPEKCIHEVNGQKYVEYVLGSDDFNERVANSKFGRMRRFAKTHQGYIALQGDHGVVSFRNVKIRPIKKEESE